MTDPDRVARAFDEVAGAYDDEYHDRVAGSLVEFLAPGPHDAVADVACGTGAVALAVACRTPARRVLAVDISAAMVDAGRARATWLGRDGLIDWRVGDAVPLPVPDASLDVVLCASSLHFLGARALADWRRALRPGGRAGFTLPLAKGFRPSAAFAALVAADVPLPRDAGDARALAASAGFVDTLSRLITVDKRTVVLVSATAPGGD